MYLDKGMTEKFGSSWPKFGVLDEAHPDEIFKIIRKIPFELRGWVVWHGEQYLHGMEIKLWGNSVCQFDGGDSQGPNIDLEGSGPFQCLKGNKENHKKKPLTAGVWGFCWITSGDIQRGVPAKVHLFAIV